MVPKDGKSLQVYKSPPSETRNPYPWRSENTAKTKCEEFGIPYVPPAANELDGGEEERLNGMFQQCERARNCQRGKRTFKDGTAAFQQCTELGIAYVNTPEKEDPSQKEDHLQRNFDNYKKEKRQRLYHKSNNESVDKCSHCGEDKEPKSGGVATELRKVAKPIEHLCAKCTARVYGDTKPKKLRVCEEGHGTPVSVLPDRFWDTTRPHPGQEFIHPQGSSFEGVKEEAQERSSLPSFDQPLHPCPSNGPSGSYGQARAAETIRKRLFLPALYAVLEKKHLADPG
jgi:hypothetical protein